MVRGSKSIVIEHSCPQCGAPVNLQETDRLLHCEYCRVKLIINSNPYPRYQIPLDDSKAEVVYLPYWRFRGMAFSVGMDRTRTGVVDSTLLALQMRGVPMTLGVRPQAVALRIMPTGAENVLRGSIDLEGARKTLEGRLQRVDRISQGQGRHSYRVIVGETISMICLPAYIRGSFIYDALTGKRLSHLEVPTDGVLNRDRHYRVDFLPTLCPNCGWDMEMDRDSLVAICKNCESLWDTTHPTPRRMDFLLIPADAPHLYVPFWRIRASVRPFPLRSYADLIRFANLPQVPRREDEERPLHFILPAFKVNPNHFLGLSRAATISRLSEGESGLFPKSASLYPVNLPVSEAAEAIKVLLAELGKPRKDVVLAFEEISVRVEDASLLLLPYWQKSYAYLNPEVRYSLPKASLRYGRYI